jgi:hypothetical protein
MSKKLCSVHQDKEGVILSCKIVESVYGKLSTISEEKDTIIKNIKDGNEYFTALWNGSLNPPKYEEKAKVKQIDGKYLRSDSNETKKDNLDELPKY